MPKKIAIPGDASDRMIEALDAAFPDRLPDNFDPDEVRKRIGHREVINAIKNARRKADNRQEDPDVSQYTQDANS